MKRYLFDPEAERIIKEAVQTAVIEFGDNVIGSEYLLFALLQDVSSKFAQYLEEKEDINSFSLRGVWDLILTIQGTKNPSYQDSPVHFKNLELERIYDELETEELGDFSFTDEFMEIVTEAHRIRRRKRNVYITVDYLTAAMVSDTEYTCNTLLDLLEVDTEHLTAVFEEERLFGKKAKDYGIDFESNLQETPAQTFAIPKELEGCCQYLNQAYEKEKRLQILKRDVEIEMVYNTLLKKEKRNVILVGEPGVGKTAIAKGIAERIVKGKCPEQLKGAKLVLLDINNLIAGAKYVGEAEERFKWIKKFIKENPDVILVIDEIHVMIGAGSSNKNDLDFANALKPMLASGDTKIIGTTTKEEYKKYFSKDRALTRRFKMIEVKEPKIKEVYPMLKNRVKALEEYHNVSVGKEAFEEVMLQALLYDFDRANPDNTRDLLDEAMVIAKKDRKEKLDLASITKVHEKNRKRFAKMSKKDKKAIAYHEVGHYSVGLMQKSNKQAIAISILPAQDYLGVTVWDDDEEAIQHSYRDWILKIAICLAGREAEKVYQIPINSGASADIENATQKARYMVTCCGLEPNGEESYVDLRPYDAASYSQLSDAEKERVNQKVQKIIEEAAQVARKNILSHKDAIERVVQGLLRKGMLTQKETDLLYRNKMKVEDLPEFTVKVK